MTEGNCRIFKIHMLSFYEISAKISKMNFTAGGKSPSRVVLKQFSYICRNNTFRMSQNIWKLTDHSDYYEERFSQHFSRGGKVFILCDENTRKYCQPVLIQYIPCLALAEIIEISSGEVHKNLDTCSQIWAQLTEHRADRNTIMINLGGGVICDMGGFAAAIYKRGLQFYHCPTTLLAQVDAAIGGKTGIDFNFFKNQLGLFCQPEGIIIHPEFINSLDHRQLLSGYAEMLKIAFVNDKNLTERLLLLKDPIQDIDQILIMESIQNKLNITEEDYLERGQRKILNFGHTIGHALESLQFMKHRPVLHGEAVAAGMICESWISREKGWISHELLDEITNYILLIFKDLIFNNEDIPVILDLMLQDKKNQAEKVNFTLLTGRGTSIINQFVEKDLQEKALTFYSDLVHK